MPALTPTSAHAETTRDRGQAAVESALTLPLTVFLLLAALQLGQLMSARLLAHYAAYRATRAGALKGGSCAAMSDAALGALMPGVYSYAGGSSGASTARKLADAIAVFKNGYRYRSPQVPDHDGPIFWLRRDRPDAADVASLGGAPEDLDFDDPSRPLRRLEVTLVFWYPMRVPFANQVMSQMARAHFGLQEFQRVNPLMPTDSRPWRAGQGRLDAMLAAEVGSRAAQRQYVFPLPVSYTMRMMTPLVARNFQSGPYCAPSP